MSDFAKDKDVLISRRAAIDLLCRALHYNYSEDYAVTQALELPTAEPERTTPGNIVIGSDGWLVYCPFCGAKMQSTMGQLRVSEQSTKGEK